MEQSNTEQVQGTPTQGTQGTEQNSSVEGTTTQHPQASPSNQTENIQQNQDGHNSNVGNTFERDLQELTKRFGTLSQRLDSVLKENERLSNEQKAAAHKSRVLEEGSKLGIPEFLLSKLDIKEGSDITKELTSIKQELVNQKLLPKEGNTSATNLDKLKASATAWAKAL